MGTSAWARQHGHVSACQTEEARATSRCRGNTREARALPGPATGCGHNLDSVSRNHRYEPARFLCSAAKRRTSGIRSSGVAGWTRKQQNAGQAGGSLRCIAICQKSRSSVSTSLPSASARSSSARSGRPLQSVFAHRTSCPSARNSSTMGFGKFSSASRSI